MFFFPVQIIYLTSFSVSPDMLQNVKEGIFPNIPPPPPLSRIPRSLDLYRRHDRRRSFKFDDAAHPDATSTSDREFCGPFRWCRFISRHVREARERSQNGFVLWGAAIRSFSWTSDRWNLDKCKCFLSIVARCVFVTSRGRELISCLNPHPTSQQ